MKFRSYDSLKVFDAVAKKQSMTAAANDLNLSKGSISYQINKLEENLGFALFERNKARLQLRCRQWLIGYWRKRKFRPLTLSGHYGSPNEILTDKLWSKYSTAKVLVRTIEQAAGRWLKIRVSNPYLWFWWRKRSMKITDGWARESYRIEAAVLLQPIHLHKPAIRACHV